MSVLRAIALDFDRGSGIPVPRDPELHNLAIEFASKELAETPDFSQYVRVWVAAEMNGEKPVGVRGALGFTVRPDITLCRFLDRHAFLKLFERTNGYFADNGCRGSEVLVYSSSTEGDEQRCPNWKETLQAVNAKPADRWLVTIR